MSGCKTLFLLFCVLAIGHLTNGENASNESPNRRSIVSSVDCYTCVSCSEIDTHTEIKTCPYNPDPLRVKKCVKFAEKLPHPVNGENKSWIVRGCASDRGTCEEIKNAYALNPDIALDYCYECEGDKCNGASRSASELFLAFFTVMVVPVIIKYTLS